VETSADELAARIKVNVILLKVVWKIVSSHLERDWAVGRVHSVGVTFL
jgi:hypothetical protein